MIHPAPFTPKTAIGEQVRLYLSDGDERVQSTLHTLTRTGIVCSLDHSQEVEHAIGDELDITLMFLQVSPWVQRCVSVRLVGRIEQERSTSLRFEFVDSTALDRFRPSELAVAMERRGCMRVQATGPVTIARAGVALETGTLVNLSCGGLAADLSADFEEVMAGRQDVECLFRLAADEPMLSVTSQIRHRTLRPDGSVRFGVMFLDSDDGRLQQVQRAILAWIGETRPPN